MLKQTEEPRRIIARQKIKQELLAIWDDEGTLDKARLRWVERLRKSLNEGRAEIKSRFLKDHDGIKAASAQTMLMDQIIRILYEIYDRHVYKPSQGLKNERMAVIALGGYGRGELCLHSDIDILFLYDFKCTSHHEKVIESILYFLWDLGLKVGQASRSINEAVKLSKQDMTILTSHLESRLITGEAGYYQDLMSNIKKQVMPGVMTKFLDAKIAEREDRHQRLGDSRYLLEPNIKEGKGGLRDLQTLRWGALALFDAHSPYDMADQGLITAEQLGKFERAMQFYLTLRQHLHEWAGRAEERLSFQAQPEMAKLMGYQDRPGASGTERLMKHYFLHAREVADLTRIIMALFETTQKGGGWLSRIRPKFTKRKLDGFTLTNGRLLPMKGEGFDKKPENMLRLFEFVAEYGLEPHPDCWDMIAQNLKKTNHNYRRKMTNNQSFLATLCDYEHSETALRMMNESGLLGKFIPDFGRVVAQMQFDMYHVYTTDEHTIRAIGILKRIELGKLKEDHPLGSRIMPQISLRRALYFAVFLHDIAKGRGGDHSVIGAEVAYKLGPRFGFSKNETEIIAWLVLHHLAMSKTATKRDLDDPKTITDFVDLVQSPERLRMLLLLTIVDIRAVGPKTWNNWKATLLRELYWRAESLMLGQTNSHSPLRQRLEAKSNHLGAFLQEQGWDEKAISHYLDLAGPHYLSQYDQDHLHAQIDIITAARQKKAPLEMNINIQDDDDYTSITICCASFQGLFAKIAGAFSLSGVEIVSANIASLKDGLALDHFIVQDGMREKGLGQSALRDRERIEKLKQILSDILAGKKDPSLLITQQQKKPNIKPRISSAIAKEIEADIVINNDASASKTVIEVYGIDRLGLLYELTQSLVDLNLQIINARIATYGEKIIDVFYVRDLYGHKITNPQRIQHIKKHLKQVLID